jgi:hypothetical protein
VRARRSPGPDRTGSGRPARGAVEIQRRSRLLPSQGRLLLCANKLAHRRDTTGPT